MKKRSVKAVSRFISATIALIFGAFGIASVIGYKSADDELSDDETEDDCADNICDEE